MSHNTQLPAAVCNWVSRVRKEGRLRVFESGELRETFRPKMEKVTGERIKLHNEEPNELFPSSNATWVMKWVGHIARMGHKKT